MGYGELDVLLAPTPGAAALPSDLHLAIDGWAHAVPLAAVLAEGRERPFLGGNATAPPSVRIVFSVPFDSPDRFALALVPHIAFHRALGFGTPLLYAADNFAPFVVAHPAAAPLTIVRWADTALFSDPEHQQRPSWEYESQTWVYMHALLSHWGDGDVRLLLSDVDEFFASPTRASVVDLLTSGCLSGAPSWPLARHDVYRAHPRGGSGGGLPATWATPPEQLTLRMLEPLLGNKLLLDPSDAFAIWVHEAVRCPDPPPPTLVPVNYSTPAQRPCRRPAKQLLNDPTPPLACAWIAHNPNLLTQRYSAPEGAVPDTSWQWPLAGSSLQ